MDTSDLYTHHTYGQSLTFETLIESTKGWSSSNIAIPLKDDCPTVLHGAYSSNTNVSNYLISFGEPNPSFREPDIYRTTRGNLNLYPQSSRYGLMNSNITGRINVYSSNNTVQLKDMLIDFSGK